MGSLQWAWSSGQRWGSVGSLWGWAASRLRLDWTTRFFQRDEESLVLTQRDELNRTYCEDNRLPPNNTRTERGPSSNGTRTARISAGEDSPGLILRDELDKTIMVERPSPSNINSTTTFIQRPGSKETKTIMTSTGPRTTTRTSVLSPQDCPWFNNPRTYGEVRPCSTEINNVYSEEKPSSNQHTNKRRSYKLARDTQRQGRGGLVLANTEEYPHRLDTRGSNPTPSITTWEAGWNVTNAIQGIFVLGLPYALVQSGYLGLVLLVLSAWVCNHTGRVLVACLYEEEHSSRSGLVSRPVRVRHSYQDIVEACCRGLWPSGAGLGGWLVNVAQVIELLMTCTLYLVVSTSLLSDSLSWMAVPRSVCSLVSLMFLLPCLLLTDLRPVSTLSLLCSLAHIVISLLVILYCLSRASGWSWSSLSLSVDPEDFLVSVGVIIFSYTSQIFLPPLEGSMEDRGEFRAMLGWTHAAACVMKTMFSLLAVLTWGADTSEVITDNLPSDLRPLVNLCLLAKALLSYPLPFYSAAEILQSCLLRGTALSPYSPGGGRGVSRPVLLVRGALLMTSYLLALLVPRFSLLMGLTGSVTGAAMTLILPCLFHLRLQWSRLNVRDRVTDLGILSLGLLCSISGVICSMKRLIQGL
ncbi:vesicular inhibitory amino acid transporter-like [Polymixia lowei]